MLRLPPRARRAFRLAVRRPDWTAREIDDEIRFHLQSRAEHLMARGWTKRDAEAEARRRFGPSWSDAVRTIHQSGQAREERLAMWERLGSLIHDVRFAIRSLRRSPGFTTTVLLTLGLCIAASVTIFTVIDAVLLRALPYPNANQLHVVFERSAEGGNRLASYPTFHDWAEQSRAFSGIAFVRGGSGVLPGTDAPDRIAVGYASPGFFRVLGAPAALGRTFLPDEERGAGNVVVLSHALWMRRFGGDPSVVGRSVTLDSAPVTVVGVMPAGVSFPDWADAWRPLAPRLDIDPVYARRNVHSDSRVIVRLAAGVDSARAASDLAAIERRIAVTQSEDAATWNAVDLRPLRDQVIGTIRPTLLMLGGAVLFVLLIACVNVANLAAVRATARSRELAIRAALGASRGRVVRQLLTESVLLAMAAGALGIVLTAWFVRGLRAAAPTGLPRVAELTVDWRVLALGVGFTLLAALACSVIPALRALRLDANESLRAGRQGSAGNRGANRARGAFTVAQFALALMLLVGAGLLIRSFQRMLDVRLGFEPAHVATLRVDPPSPRYDTPEAMAELDRRMMAAVARVPGVSAVAVVNHTPLSGAYVTTRVLVPGRLEDPKGNDVALYKTVSEGYLRVMGVRLLAGRWFGAGDMTAHGNGVVISDVVASRYWPHQNPIGKPLTIFRSSQGRPDFGQPMPSEVVGVVTGARHFGPSDDPMPEVFVPFTREVWPWVNVAVRTNGDPERSLTALRRAVHAVDPTIPLEGSARMSGFQPMQRYMTQLLEPRRYLTALLVGFALSALLLAAIGVYGVTSYGVVQRTSEIGVRMALGASPARIVLHVVRQGALFAATGVAIGLAGAVALGRVVGSLLFDTSPLDPPTLVAVTLLLMGIAVVACLLPARRGARIEPSVAMRTD